MQGERETGIRVCHQCHRCHTSPALTSMVAYARVRTVRTPRYSAMYYPETIRRESGDTGDKLITPSWRAGWLSPVSENETCDSR
jgi:hypothetical protein